MAKEPEGPVFRWTITSEHNDPERVANVFVRARLMESKREAHMSMSPHTVLLLVTTLLLVLALAASSLRYALLAVVPLAALVGARLWNRMTARRLAFAGVND